MTLRAPIAAAVLALLAAAPAAHAAIPTLHVRSVKQIRDDPKVAAKIRAGGRTVRAEIEYRGSSTLAFRKKPYAIETDRKTRLLGMPRERDWVLNAAYTDPTLLRDTLAARRNFARWDVLGRAVFPGQRVQASHAAAVAAQKDWIVRRAAWMDGALG